MNELPLIEVNDLGKRYLIGSAAQTTDSRAMRDRAAKAKHETDEEKHLWALRHVSFSLRRGERLGIIGNNGAGKSTLLKILSRVAYPTEGNARIRGRVTALLEVGTGFSELLTGRENIALNAQLYGLSQTEVSDRTDAIIAFSELERFIDTPIKYYSTGMRARLAFAVAAHIDPDILILDEVLAVGDLAFQRKCLERMEDMTGAGRTLLFVSHGLDAITRFCDRCLWLEKGLVRLDGEAAAVVEQYAEEAYGTKAAAKVEALKRATVAAPPSAAPEEDDGVEAQLLDATIIDASGNPINVVPTNSRVGVRFTYQVSDEGVFLPAVGLFTGAGIHVLQSAPTSTKIADYRRAKGTYTSTAWLPENLLNVGSYSVSLHLADPRFSPMKRYLRAERILSFVTVDAHLSEVSPRSIVATTFPGVVRPPLDWATTSAAEKAESASA